MENNIVNRVPAFTLFQINTLYVGDCSHTPSDFIHIIRCMREGCPYNIEFRPNGYSRSDDVLMCVCGEDDHAFMLAWQHVMDHGTIDEMVGAIHEPDSGNPGETG